MGQEPIRATRLTAQDLVKRQTKSAAIRSQAGLLMENAKLRANEIIQNAEKQRTERESDLKDLSKEELRKFIDEDSLKQHTDGFIKLLREIRTIRDEHDAMVPWLTDLVSISVERILGDIDRPELIARVVQRGVAELGQKYTVTVHAAAAMIPHLKSAQQLFPDLFETVDRFIADKTVPMDSVILACQAGSVEMSISSQLSAILENLSQAETIAPPAVDDQ